MKQKTRQSLGFKRVSCTSLDGIKRGCQSKSDCHALPTLDLGLLIIEYTVKYTVQRFVFGYIPPRHYIHCAPSLPFFQQPCTRCCSNPACFDVRLSAVRSFAKGLLPGNHLGLPPAHRACTDGQWARKFPRFYQAVDGCPAEAGHFFNGFARQEIINSLLLRHNRILFDEHGGLFKIKRLHHRHPSRTCRLPPLP